MNQFCHDMLKTRSFNSNDLKLVQQIHERYYPQLEFPNFTKMLNAFIIEDNKNEFIMAGGLIPTAEGVLITDKSQSLIKIGRALVEAQLISLYTCKKFNIQELFAFTDEKNYSTHLIQHGFLERGNVLSIKLE